MIKRIIACAAAVVLGVPLPAAADEADPCIASFAEVQRLRNAGKLTDARREAAHCAAICAHSDYATRKCEKWALEIEESRPTVVFDVKGPTGVDATAVRVSVDGEVVLAQLDGKALALDPGQHTLTFEIEGQPAKTEPVVLKQGEKNRPIRVSFQVVEAPASPAAPAPRVISSSSRTTKLGQQIAGIVVNGVGLLGVIGGAAFLHLANVKKAESNAPGNCPEGNSCDSVGVELRTDARAAGNAATALLITGGANFVGGIVIALTAPSRKARGTAFAVGGGIRRLELMVSW